ncbi:nucleotidyltransferase domain-containing protein [Kordiimonas sp. SCSIO 12610]|uniref:nucleotidyltransferase domain-containing protein n=1 Tax=Kordiimonas sp. SCSIO 12610 TaxID=2829597 RepID=UPI00210B4A54|nr:nucleotidyltransferase domain-containing protein [Kordiimonas sp. SCSIO 12610]UTW54811.1 nucleotidyltransferase domain-containing protein [Kordiimonas sp. SCSIO 12610]
MNQLANISPSAHTEIMENLNAIQSDHDVRILFAIESGSRAWGFPSPDSDYDVRFVYVHSQDWYLTITPGRDVIELPLFDKDTYYENRYEHDLDINGWDLKKALNLLMKPNPVLLEWLSSPIRYMWNNEACDDLTALSRKVTFGPACLHHYLNLGRRQWNTYVGDKTEVNLKKYFYIVRPAMAIRWLRMNSDITPPMNFYDLKAGINLSANLNEQLDELLEKKSRSKELGEAKRIDIVDKFVMNELFWASEAVKKMPRASTNLQDEANNIFKKWIKLV